MNHSDPRLGIACGIALPPTASPHSMKQRWWTIVVTVRVMVVLATYIGLIDGSRSTSSRLLDSHELLVGTWETTIQLARQRSSDPTASSQLRSMMLWPKNPKQKRTSTARQYALHLFQNFTCVLEPKEELNVNDPGPFQHDRPLPPRCLYGSWKIHPNPYCPTDRFYDTVEFAFSSSNDTSASSLSRATTTGVLTARDWVWVGRCRLTGHYSPGRLFFRARRPFAQGRLSHGVLQQLCRHEKVGPSPPQPIQQRQEASTLSDGAGGGETTTAPAVVERRNAILLRARFVGRRSITSEDTLYDLDEAEDRRLFGY
jgi:hypothetical protein